MIQRTPEPWELIEKLVHRDGVAMRRFQIIGKDETVVATFWGEKSRGDAVLLAHALELEVALESLRSIALMAVLRLDIEQADAKKRGDETYCLAAYHEDLKYRVNRAWEALTKISPDRKNSHAINSKQKVCPDCREQES